MFRDGSLGATTFDPGTLVPTRPKPSQKSVNLKMIFFLTIPRIWLNVVMLKATLHLVHRSSAAQQLLTLTNPLPLQLSFI